jgi:hypothetical protein
LDVEHEERVVLTTFIVKGGFKAFSYEFTESMSFRRIVVMRRDLLLWRLILEASAEGAMASSDAGGSP